MVFNLQIIDVPYLASMFYVGFIQRTIENDICIKIENVLKVNFAPVAQVKMENWMAIVIEPLFFAP